MAINSALTVVLASIVVYPFLWLNVFIFPNKIQTLFIYTLLGKMRGGRGVAPALG
jgi:hypothetical protein